MMNENNQTSSDFNKPIKEKSKIKIGQALALIIITLLVTLVVSFALKKDKYGVVFVDGDNVEVSVYDADSKVPKRDISDENFIGWYLNDEKYNFDNKLKGNIVLKAKYEKVIKYTVKFNTDGGNAIDDQTVIEGKQVVLPIPTKTGYKFVEWQLDGKKFEETAKINSNITLIAIWEESSNKIEYTVKFNSNGGTTIKNQIVNENSKATKPANPIKAGYNFTEWQLKGKKFDFNEVITENIELTAVWKEKENVTVTFDSMGGSAIASATIKYNSKLAKPTAPTKEGYKFDKWLLEGKEFNFATNINRNITLKAKWIQKKYKVTIKSVDQYTPDVTVILTEDGTNIPFNKITYSGATLCTGANPTVNRSDFDNISTVTVVLKSGQTVTAQVVK